MVCRVCYTIPYPHNSSPPAYPTYHTYLTKLSSRRDGRNLPPWEGIPCCAMPQNSFAMPPKNSLTNTHTRTRPNLHASIKKPRHPGLAKRDPGRPGAILKTLRQRLLRKELMNIKKTQAHSPAKRSLSRQKKQGCADRNRPVGARPFRKRAQGILGSHRKRLAKMLGIPCIKCAALRLPDASKSPPRARQNPDTRARKGRQAQHTYHTYYTYHACPPSLPEAGEANVRPARKPPSFQKKAHRAPALADEKYRWRSGRICNGFWPRCGAVGSKASPFSARRNFEFARKGVREKKSAGRPNARPLLRTNLFASRLSARR